MYLVECTHLVCLQFFLFSQISCIIFPTRFLLSKLCSLFYLCSVFVSCLLDEVQIVTCTYLRTLYEFYRFVAFFGCSDRFAKEFCSRFVSIALRKTIDCLVYPTANGGSPCECSTRSCFGSCFVPRRHILSLSAKKEANRNESCGTSTIKLCRSRRLFQTDRTVFFG